MNSLFLGFYLGIFSIILLFNILWYVYNKEKAYLYYFFMHLSVVFLSLNTLEVLLIPTVPIAIFAIFFSFLFAKEFLNLNKYYPSINKYVLYTAYIIPLILFLLYITDNSLLIKYIPFSFIFLSFVLIAYKVYKKGFVLAKYFVIAWSVNYVIILLTDINRIFNIEIIHFEYLSQIGNILEAVILSFALFAKTSILTLEKNEKEKMLIHQSRLASMGEMLANISHQWRQPLNRIASLIINMQIHIMDKYKDEKYLLEKLEQSQIQLEYMSETIEDFTNFYKKDKQKEEFYVSSMILNASNIIKPTLKSNNINLKIEIIEDFKLNSFPKELSQVILNLLQNAKDALIFNQIIKPKINIVIDTNTIIVKDNANGITKDIIEKIFEPYFTTKDKHQGTGLGLYMSKMILEKNMNASIIAINTKDGVEFIIKF